MVTSLFECYFESFIKTTWPGNVCNPSYSHQCRGKQAYNQELLITVSQPRTKRKMPRETGARWKMQLVDSLNKKPKSEYARIERAYRAQINADNALVHHA